MNSFVTSTKQYLPQFYRQKFLVAFLQLFNHQLNSTDFQKLLFLFNELYRPNKKIFHFVPYKYGPFSFQAYADIRRLSDLSIFQGETPTQCIEQTSYFHFLTLQDQIDLKHFYNQFKELQGDELIRFVYSEYPYYAKNSEIKDKIIGLRVNEPSLESQYSNTIFTLGYEGKTIDEYLNILVKNEIKALIDVRKNPVSMKYGFSKKTIQKALENLRIVYQHFPELGIESADRKDLSSFEAYQQLFEKYEETILSKAADSLKRIFNQYQTYKRISLLCFEKDPQYCHRSRISKKIEQLYGVAIKHL